MANRIIAEGADAHSEQNVLTASQDDTETTTAMQQVESEEYSGNDIMRAGELAPIVNSGPHEALTLMARWRDLSGADDHYPYSDQVVEAFTLLTHSPAFRSFLEEALQSDHASGDKNWNLGWFAAEMFCAGVLTGRREFGRRPATPYDLELDQVTNVAVRHEDLERVHNGKAPAGRRG